MLPADLDPIKKGVSMMGRAAWVARVSPSKAIAAGVGAGIVAGLVAAAATARTTDSIHNFSQAIVLGALLSTCFSLAFGFAALAVQVGAEYFQRHRREATATPWMALSLCLLIAWGLSIGGLWIHDLGLGSPLPEWLFRPLLAALVAVLTVWLYGSQKIRKRRSAVATIGLILVAAAALLWMVSDTSRRVVGSPTELPLSATERQVFFFGVDGADWRRIDLLIAAKRLPNLEALQASGFRAPLTTTSPTHSPVIWTSIMTGVDADQHGIHGFTAAVLPGLPCGLQGVSQAERLPPKFGLGKLAKLGYSLGLIEERPISSCQRRVKSLWNILSGVGLRVGIVNWFVSWPSDAVNGFLVSDNYPVRARFNLLGRGSTYSVAEGVTHPPELLGELAEMDLHASEVLPSDPLRLPFFQDLDEQELEVLRTKRERLDQFRVFYMADLFAARAALHLYERESLDFLALYMSGVDNVSHRFGLEHPAIVDRYYEFIDEVLGRLMAKMSQRTTLLVVSDHGWDYEEEDFGHSQSPDGVLLAGGHQVARGIRFGTAAAFAPDQPSIFDLAPTVLHLFGLPATSYMPGRILGLGHGLVTESLPPIASYGRYRPPPIPRRTRAGEAEMDETMKKLRALGYVQ